MIDFIKSDQYTLDLVKKLTSIRKVNDQPRVIRKIKRDEIWFDQFLSFVFIYMIHLQIAILI